ncbi:MAG: 4,5-DOPA dioxygenase extradiol [Flavobacteriia bacterium]|nr:4,5-DOPA dioxygenase extradiol [Flavobacteriia bacterium]
MTSNSQKMPVLFIGHGNPMYAIESNVYSHAWEKLGKSLPKPKAILAISAHWLTEGTSVTAMEQPETIHDFGGFPQKLFDVQYPAPGSLELAKRVKTLIKSREVELDHQNWGLDHGAWVPLRVMYPDADIPVLQMSMPTSDPGKLIELGKRLQPLRDMGVLIIGSGFMTHGLPYLRDWSTDAKAPTWSSEFDAWAAEALAKGDVETLSAFTTKAPGMPYAHPTVEHFTPLFITLGAAQKTDAPVETLIDGYFMGLSKRSILVA